MAGKAGGRGSALILFSEDEFINIGHDHAGMMSLVFATEGEEELIIQPSALIKTLPVLVFDSPEMSEDAFRG
jgi:hypothetical protein